jgi:hypothetical protein
VTTDDSSAPQQEAVELPPRREGDPEALEVLVYPTGQKGVLEVYSAGQWRLAIVRARLRFPQGTAYTVLLDPGTGRHEVRTYAWPTGLRVKFVPPSAPSL